METTTESEEGSAKLPETQQ
ncbi:hypothetical protein LYNGBM3L_34770 [Moorena producens 3L]|uniref:Uncharacterized protein n=1 Tax=Moorena producens 3L TaxID=489825 RepID=F4XPR3_9CYAN|nr:hypothetical protein LYNGBM3L_34770 [Moorena producens 3L]